MERVGMVESSLEKRGSKQPQGESFESVWIHMYNYKGVEKWIKARLLER